MTETNAAAEAEAERAFEKDKTIFEQDCQEFRSLNGFPLANSSDRFHPYGRPMVRSRKVEP